MTFVKDRSCIKYFIISAIILICIYLNILADFFVPIFDNIYYGNLVRMFTAIISAIIWGLEVILITYICKRNHIICYTSTETKKQSLKLWRIVLLFALTILPMFIISAVLNFKLKIVHSLGVRVTIVGLLCNACEMLAYAVRMLLMIMFISCIQKGFEKIIKTKITIPYGAIFAILTFGLIDFFFFNTELAVFYLVVSFLYGIIYIVTQKKFALTWLLCYLIYLL